MTLIESVQPTLDKLKKRIEKEGLRDLTHLDYDRYLNTSLWSKIKHWIYERDGHTCRICSSEGRFIEMDVHHRSYDLDVLEGRNEEMLVTLCRRCHTLIEQYPDGRRRHDLQEKDVEYFRLIEIHTNMCRSRIPLNLSSKLTSRSVNISLWHDQNEALIFTSLESLLFHYSMVVYHANREAIRIPMPFGRDRFHQKSGARFFDRGDGKVLMSIRMVNGEALIKISSNTAVPFQDTLVEVIADSVWKPTSSL